MPHKVPCFNEISVVFTPPVSATARTGMRSAPRTRRFIQVSHMDGKDPSFWGSTCGLPGCTFTGSCSQEQALNPYSPMQEVGILTIRHPLHLHLVHEDDSSERSTPFS